MSDQERLEAIRERDAAATPGPWETAKKAVKQSGDETTGSGRFGGICNCLGFGYGAGVNHPVNVQARTNADFIAHAREDIPYLLAQLDEARKDAQTWRKQADLKADKESEWRHKYAEVLASRERLRAFGVAMMWLDLGHKTLDGAISVLEWAASGAQDDDARPALDAANALIDADLEQWEGGE